jgi:hypothetical protein
MNKDVGDRRRKARKAWESSFRVDTARCSRESDRDSVADDAQLAPIAAFRLRPARNAVNSRAVGSQEDEMRNVAMSVIAFIGSKT